MPPFPVDTPIERVGRALECLGFQIVRKGNHNFQGMPKCRWNAHAVDYCQPPTSQELHITDNPHSSTDIT